MPRSPDHWWYSQGDRERIDAIQAKLAKYRGLAENATNDRDRRRYSQHVAATERELRTFRTYPFSIWLGGMAVSIALLPLAFLARSGHSTLGLAAAAIVAVIEAALITSRRRRRRLRAHNGKT